MGGRRPEVYPTRSARRMTSGRRSRYASPAVSTAEKVQPLPLAVRLSDLSALTKPGITLMVTLTAGLGFLLAGGTPFSAMLLIHTLLGTALVSAGASVLNQFLERDVDALMERTAQRPLPTGRMDAESALLFGSLLALSGLVELAVAVNVLTALLGAVALVGYVFVYTPLKRITSLATVVGAVPGAIPPMMGWTAVTSEIDLAAWVLFAILFFWQMPHFLAIAWMYKDDYANAGIPLLPVLEPDGRRTGQQALMYTAGLWPVSLLPAVIGLAGVPYMIVATVLGLLFVWLAVRFARERSMANARTLFLFSITYLPLLLGALVADRLWL